MRLIYRIVNWKVPDATSVTSGTRSNRIGTEGNRTPSRLSRRPLPACFTTFVYHPRLWVPPRVFYLRNIWL